MQTFLPYSDYYKSLDCLDPSRLGNQVWREGLTILRGGWKNHPIAKMWKDYRYQLGLYCLEGIKILLQRNNKYYYEVENKILNEMKQLSFCQKPRWIGNEELHASHRSNLLRKGIEDLTFNLYHNNDLFPKLKSKWKQEHYELTWKLYGKPDVKDTWYGKFNWTEPDNLPYVWFVDE